MNENVEDVINSDRIRKVCAQLGEHFDTVQIFCTKMDDNNRDTKHYRYGNGNWFARYGYLKSYVSDIEKGYILGNEQNQDNNKAEWE